MINIRHNQLNIIADSLEKKVVRAFSSLEEIRRYLTQKTYGFQLSREERNQIVAALAYARSQRRPGISDAAQQLHDWMEAETDLDLILIHLRALRPHS